MNLDGPFRAPKSLAGATRQYKAIWRELRRHYAGGLTYGLDWPTLRSAYPVAAEHLWQMRKDWNV
jgi:hypothetical protein